MRYVDETGRGVPDLYAPRPQDRDETPPPYRVTPSYANPDFAFYVVQTAGGPDVTVSWDPAWQATPYVCLAHPLAGTPGHPACGHIEAVEAYRRAAVEGSAE